MSTFHPPPSHRSFSQVKTWLSCGKQYQLQRVFRAPETPAWYLAGGSAVHEAIEFTTRAVHSEGTDGAPDDTTIGEVWDTVWHDQVNRLLQDSGVPTDEWRAAGRATKDKPNKEDGQWWKVDGLEQIKGYRDWLVNQYQAGMVVFDDDNGPWVERGMTVPVGGVLTKMFVDAVFVMPGGELIVVDHKTGSRAPDPQQLRLYAYGMELAGFPRPSLGAYYMTRKRELTAPSVLDPGMDKVLDDVFMNVDGAIRAGVFPANVSSMCGSCGVNKFCAAYGGSEAHNWDPILDGGK